MDAELLLEKEDNILVHLTAMDRNNHTNNEDTRQDPKKELSLLLLLLKGLSAKSFTPRLVFTRKQEILSFINYNA